MTILKQTLLILCLFTISFSFSQETIRVKNIEEVSVSDFVKEIKIIKKNKDNFKMVWWVPSEYWTVAMQGSTVVPAQYVDQFVETLEEYILIGSLHSELTTYGAMKTKPTKLQIKDKNGTLYEELENSEISNEYLEVLSTLKPAMVNTLGDFGKQMKFHVFRKTGKDGKLLAPPTKSGELTILFNTKNKFSFKLPLSCLVAEKVCPTDSELLNGNWKYCPWHGKKLKLQTK